MAHEAHSRIAAKGEWAGYQSAMADMNAILATTYGDDTYVLDRIKEWVENNSAYEFKAEREARVMEFLS